MKFYIVDAFTEELFGGNPAGVVVIPEGGSFPSEETMLKTAAELRYSETAFVLPLDEENFKIRYFTPTAEVDLCGHATIASFQALQSEGLVRYNIDYNVETLAGDIKVRIDEGITMMGMAEPEHISTISDTLDLDRLYDIMGGEYDASLGLNPMIISTGLPDIMMPVANIEELNSLAPNMDALTELSRSYGVTGVHAFTISRDENDEFADAVIHVRNFAPLYGIDEEAATGTANGALTFYLKINDILDIPSTCKVIQGEKMGRPSVIMTSIQANPAGVYVLDGPSLESEYPTIHEIFVGGSARILAKGEINI